MTQVSEDIKERVKALWSEGLPASEISVIINTEFGGVRTRSAILGMVHRMRLRDGAAPRSPAHRSAPSAPPARKPAERKRPEAAKASAPHPSPLTIVTLAPKPPAVAELPGPVDGVLLMLAAGRDCRWPVSGSGADLMICGATQRDGSPYCAAHHRLAYVSAEKRRAA